MARNRRTGEDVPRRHLDDMVPDLAQHDEIVRAEDVHVLELHPLRAVHYSSRSGLGGSEGAVCAPRWYARGSRCEGVARSASEATLPSLVGAREN